jgi:hypothetical protein
MPRYVAGTRTGAGSTTLPIISVYAASGSGLVFREAGMFNTTTTAVALKMVRLTSQATPGSALTAAEYDGTFPNAAATPFGTHSSTGPSLGDDLGMRDACGGAVGAGCKFTAAGRGVVVAAGTANGVGAIVATGTGQITDAYLVWDE